MSGPTENWAWNVTNVSGPAKFVLIYLGRKAYYDDGTAAWPSVATIAEKCGISERSVHRALTELQEKGYLRKGDQEFSRRDPQTHRIIRKGYRTTVWDVVMKGAHPRPESIIEHADAIPDDGTPYDLGPDTDDRGDTAAPLRGDTQSPLTEATARRHDTQSPLRGDTAAPLRGDTQSPLDPAGVTESPARGDTVADNIQEKNNTSPSIPHGDSENRKQKNPTDDPTDPTADIEALAILAAFRTLLRERGIEPRGRDRRELATARRLIDRLGPDARTQVTNLTRHALDDRFWLGVVDSLTTLDRNWQKILLQTARTQPADATGPATPVETRHAADCPHVQRIIRDSRLLKASCPHAAADTLATALADSLNDGLRPADAIHAVIARCTAVKAA